MEAKRHGSRCRWLVKRQALLPLALPLLLSASLADARDVQWRFDRLDRIGGFPTEIEGAPKVVESPVGRAVEFDGIDDSIKVLGRPLVGARRFTIEVIIRPDGGEFEQRFLHIAQTDPVTGQDSAAPGVSDPTPRMMYELRVKDGRWYPDAFVLSAAGNAGVIDAKKTFETGRWYAISQTYDGKILRSYVNGVLQGQAEVPFTPHGDGHVRIGARMNLISHFRGAIARIRFSNRALAAGELLRSPAQPE